MDARAGADLRLAFAPAATAVPEPATLALVAPIRGLFGAISATPPRVIRA